MPFKLDGVLRTQLVQLVQLGHSEPQNSPNRIMGKSFHTFCPTNIAPSKMPWVLRKKQSIYSIYEYPTILYMFENTVSIQFNRTINCGIHMSKNRTCYEVRSSTMNGCIYSKPLWEYGTGMGQGIEYPKKKVANGLPKRSTWTGESVHCLDVQFAKHMEVSSKWGYTKIENDGFIMENPSINGWFGGTPISGNLQISALMTSWPMYIPPLYARVISTLPTDAKSAPRISTREPAVGWGWHGFQCDLRIPIVGINGGLWENPSIKPMNGKLSSYLCLMTIDDRVYQQKPLPAESHGCLHAAPVHTDAPEGVSPAPSWLLQDACSQ